MNVEVKLSDRKKELSWEVLEEKGGEDMGKYSQSPLCTCVKMHLRKPGGTGGCAGKNKSLHHLWMLSWSSMNVTFGNVLKIAFRFSSFQKYVFNLSTQKNPSLLQNCLRSWGGIDIAVYLTKSFTNNTFPKSINSLFSQGSLSSNSGTFPPFQVHQCLPILPLAKTTFSCSVCHSWIYMWNIIQKTHLKLPGCIFFLSQIVTYHVNIGSNAVKFLCFSEKNPYCIVSKTLLHSLSPHLREHWGPSMEASSPLSRFKLLLSLP